jgi:hypothetical protein
LTSSACAGEAIVQRPTTRMVTSTQKGFFTDTSLACVARQGGAAEGSRLLLSAERAGAFISYPGSLHRSGFYLSNCSLASSGSRLVWLVSARDWPISKVAEDRFGSTAPVRQRPFNVGMTVESCRHRACRGTGAKPNPPHIRLPETRQSAFVAALAGGIQSGHTRSTSSSAVRRQRRAMCRRAAATAAAKGETVRVQQYLRSRSSSLPLRPASEPDLHGEWQRATRVPAARPTAAEPRLGLSEAAWSAKMVRLSKRLLK